MKRIAIAAAIAALLSLQGCLVAAVGAGIGAARYGTAKKQENYAAYRIEAEKLNFEREKAGLSPNPPMTFEQWDEGTK